MHRPPKGAPSTRFVSPCGLQRAWPGAADDARQTLASFRHPDAGRFCWMPGLSVLASDSEAFDGQRVSGRVGGSQRGGASARSAKSTSECACVRSMDCFLSAARWQSSASRGRRCGRAATHLRYDAHSGQTYFSMRASSAASMAASASVPAAGEPGVPAMKGSMSSSSPASAWLPWASGLSTLPPLHPRSSPLRRQGSSHVETLPRQHV